MTPEDDLYPSNGLRNIFRRRRQPWDETLPSGQTVDEAIQQQTQAARPRTMRDVLLQRTAQPTPQNPIPQAASQSDALPQQLPAPTTPTQGLPDSAFPQTRQRIADPITFDEQHLRELENKKEGFWRRLGAASIRAAQAATHQDISPVLTTKERDEARLQNQLGRDVTLAKARQGLEMNDLIPFQLPDGSWTQVPRKTAGTLANRQWYQKGQLSARKAQLDEYKSRHAQMARHEAMQDAQRKYNSGLADGNDDLKDEMVKELGLPEGTRLPDHNQGQVVTDANGNFQIVDRRTKTATPVTQPSETGTPQPVGSMTGTLERGRNQRAAAAQAGANQRAGMRQGGQGRVSTDKTAQRRAALLSGQVENVRKELEAFDSRNVGPDASGKRPPEVEARRKRIADKAAAAITELNNLGAGYEAGIGEGGYPYTKQSQQVPQVQQGGISESQIRDAAKAKGLDPDVAVQRARARGIL